MYKIEMFKDLSIASVEVSDQGTIVVDLESMTNPDILRVQVVLSNKDKFQEYFQEPIENYIGIGFVSDTSDPSLPMGPNGNRLIDP